MYDEERAKLICTEVGCNQQRMKPKFDKTGNCWKYPIRCAACHSTRSKYGINTPQKVELLKQQQNTCPICQESIEFKLEKGYGSCRGAAVVDHCHNEGHVRGILCGACNIMLGNAKDSYKILERAISYLKTAKQQMPGKSRAAQGCSKPIIVAGKLYPSIKEASRVLGWSTEKILTGTVTGQKPKDKE